MSSKYPNNLENNLKNNLENSNNLIIWIVVIIIILIVNYINNKKSQFVIGMPEKQQPKESKQELIENLKQLIKKRYDLFTSPLYRMNPETDRTFSTFKIIQALNKLEFYNLDLVTKIKNIEDSILTTSITLDNVTKQELALLNKY